MRLLLDTHVWIWQGAQSKRLGAQTRAALEDRKNELFLSIASIWELAIKDEAGKLNLPVEFQVFVRTLLAKSETALLNVSLDHLFVLKSLERRHRDPFDRLLVAQAQIEAMTLVTADERLFPYPAPTLDART
ncbi:MAG TPA: type II toxin-antitoxin system VapC family toxin [Verrucomicrobiae bacterium]|jgi:PIN domain nuclease of toxin-antitoxin system|nr:type II toxin-antitoxin system VapC family toxin [Verrucomicrobiae bacterium]